MKDNILPPNFPGAPAEYSQEFFDDLVRRLRLFLVDQLLAGPVEVSTLRMLEVPTSSSGLPAFSVWSDSGTLKIVLAVAEAQPSGNGMTVALGTVTVSTP